MERILSASARLIRVADMTFALGIMSAVVAPFMMVLGFMIWDKHWKGSTFSLNMYKCNLAAIGFAVVSHFGRHTVGFPAEVFTAEKVGFLMLSSTIGILIGDWTWLEGMRILGARKVIVMDSLKPFLATLLGEVFLFEKLQSAAFVGLVLTVLGVGLVGFEKERKQQEISSEKETGIPFEIESPKENDSLLLNSVKNESYLEMRKSREQSSKEIAYGWTMSFSNVVLHTFGVLITKKFGVGMTTWEINFIRFGFAGVCMLLLSILLHLGSRGTDGLDYDDIGGHQKPWYLLPVIGVSSWIRVSAGVVFVSFLQPALTNYAMFQISLALLLTLESIGPLYSLPLSFLLQNESPGFRATIGAVLTVTGIAILSFKGMIED